MARTQEKHQLTMNRWSRYQALKDAAYKDGTSREKKPRRRKQNKHPNFGPWEANPNVVAAENGRRDLIKELQQILDKLYKSNDDLEIRKLNEKMNSKMNEKEELESTINKMGGTNYKVHGTPITDDVEVGPDGTRYFGPARNFLGNRKRQMSKDKTSFVGQKSTNTAILAGLQKRKRRGLKAKGKGAKRQKTEDASGEKPVLVANLDSMRSDSGSDDELSLPSFRSKKPIEFPNPLAIPEGPARKPEWKSPPTSPKKTPTPSPKQLPADQKAPLTRQDSGEKVFGLTDDFSARQFPQLDTYRPAKPDSDEEKEEEKPKAKPLEERALPKEYIAKQYEKQATTFDEIEKGAKSSSSTTRGPTAAKPVDSATATGKPEKAENSGSEEEGGTSAMSALAAMDW